MKRVKPYYSKRMPKGSMSSDSRAFRARTALMDSWARELDDLRVKYGYTLTKEPGYLWDSSARVPVVKRERMVKLMRMIDALMGTRVKKYPYCADAPSCERYHWRCMCTPMDGSAGHLWKSVSSPRYQIRERP